jgi:ubiquinone/menaquinone biosynthesis C-methylase UbiE
LKLNIGCGREILDGWVNADRYPVDPRVVEADLMHLQFPDDSFDEIIAKHVIEHVEDAVTAFNELWRVAKHGAKITIVTPRWTSRQSWTDPTHRWHFDVDTIDFFTEQGFSSSRPPNAKAVFDIVIKEITNTNDIVWIVRAVKK